MKLYNVKNINGFFEAVKGCKGDINMVLPNDVINLKDNIKTYSNMFEGLKPAGGIPELDIETEYAEDTAKLLRFAVRG